jgi:hypothetical protein
VSKEDLAPIFGLTLAVTAIIATVALSVAPDWGWHFLRWGTLAWFNWIGLSLLVVGVLDKGLVRIGLGATIKLSCLVMLVVFARRYGVEVTSFLTGLHAFLAVALVYGVFKLWLVGQGSRKVIP